MANADSWEQENSRNQRAELEARRNQLHFDVVADRLCHNCGSACSRERCLACGTEFEDPDVEEEEEEEFEEFEELEEEEQSADQG